MRYQDMPLNIRCKLRFMAMLCLVMPFMAACAGGGINLSANSIDQPIITQPDPSFHMQLAAAYQYYYLDKDQFGLSRQTRQLLLEKARRAVRSADQGQYSQDSKSPKSPKNPKSNEQDIAASDTNLSDRRSIKSSVNPVIVLDSINPDSLRNILREKRNALVRQIDRDDHRLGDIPILAQAQAAFDCQILSVLQAQAQAVPLAEFTAYQTCYRRFETLIDRLQSPLWPQLEYHIFFETGRTVLTPQMVQAIHDIADIKKKDPYARLVIAGHSDGAGNNVANTRIAIQRARAVRNILLQFGVRENELFLFEDNLDHPAFVGFATKTTPAQQRRVSILVDQNIQ